MAYTPQQIIDLVNKGDGPTGMYGGSDTAAKLAALHKEIADDMLQLQGGMGEHWQGDAAGQAYAGAGPMVQASQVSGDHLAQAQNLYVGQGSSFNDLHNKVAAVGNIGDKPSDDLFSDTPFSFMSNRADEISAYNQKAQQVVDGYGLYHGQSTDNSGRWQAPSNYGALGMPPAGGDIQPTTPATGGGPGTVGPGGTGHIGGPSGHGGSNSGYNGAGGGGLSVAAITAAVRSLVVRVEVVVSRAHLARVVPHLFTRRSRATAVPPQQATSRRPRRLAVLAVSATSLSAATAAVGTARVPAVPGPATSVPASAVSAVALDLALASVPAVAPVEVAAVASVAVDRVAPPVAPGRVRALVNWVPAKGPVRGRWAVNPELPVPAVDRRPVVQVGQVLRVLVAWGVAAARVKVTKTPSTSGPPISWKPTRTMRWSGSCPSCAAGHRPVNTSKGPSCW
jgi:hypothetical protein